MRVRLLGVPVDATTLDDAVASILGWTGTRASNTAHFVNVHLLVSGHDDRSVGRALEASTFNAMDGMPLAWMARLLGRHAERVSGPDTMWAVMDRGRERGVRHYLYGSTPEVLGALEARLVAELPGVIITGTWSPPYSATTSADLEADLARVSAASPDLVWVGLGAPKQDWWVEAARAQVAVSGLLAVGAAFDFHAGTRRRAPRWMQRSGLEWVFRLISEPRRLWRRYAVTNTRFLILAGAQLLRRRRSDSAAGSSTDDGHGI